MNYTEMDARLMLLGLVAVAAMWDALRRHINARRYNQDVLDRLQKQDAEIEKLHGQLQGVMGKINLTGAAVATRAQRPTLGRLP